MKDAREAPFVHLLAQDLDHVLIGIAAVDDQRQTGRPGGRDMVAETLPLVLARAAVVVIIEPGFADAHDLRQPRPRQQSFGRNNAFVGDMMGMNA